MKDLIQQLNQRVAAEEEAILRFFREIVAIPSIGFGPGNEIYAHAVNEHVPLKDVVEATKFYALLPAMLKNNL